MEGVSTPAASNSPTIPRTEQGLLLVDLLSLRKKFSFARYRVDILGFLAALAMILAIMLLALLLSKVNT
jgi:hypothetical protein